MIHRIVSEHAGPHFIEIDTDSEKGLFRRRQGAGLQSFSHIDQPKGTGHTSFRIGSHPGQRFTDLRKGLNRAPKSPAVSRIGTRNDPCSPSVSGTTHGVVQATGGDHQVDHRLKALLYRSQRLRLCAFEIDFATGHRASAQFVFETTNSKTIGFTICTESGNQKESQTPGARLRARYPSRQQKHIRIGIGTKPLFSSDSPLPIYLFCLNGIGTHIGAALHLRQKLRGGKVGIEIRVEQRLQKAFFLCFCTQGL